MLRVKSTREFKKALKKYSRSGRFNRLELQSVIELLASEQRLDLKYHDHDLSGDMIGMRECHIKPDLLLLYRVEKKELILFLLDLGSHSELFG